MTKDEIIPLFLMILTAIFITLIAIVGTWKQQQIEIANMQAALISQQAQIERLTKLATDADEITIYNFEKHQSAIIPLVLKGE